MIVLIKPGCSIDQLPRNKFLGRIVSPRHWNLVKPGERWAADNDAFLAWDEPRFLMMLERNAGIPGCLFVAAPDVVGDAKATADRFWDWHLEITGRGYPIALVGQDGAEDLDLEWAAFDAFFIGGTTEWKLSAAAADLMAEAKLRGKWVHMGRVNTLMRIRQAWAVDVDSIDGSGWAKFQGKYLERHLPYLESIQQQRKLF